MNIFYIYIKFLLYLSKGNCNFVYFKRRFFENILPLYIILYIILSLYIQKLNVSCTKHTFSKMQIIPNKIVFIDRLRFFIRFQFGIYLHSLSLVTYFGGIQDKNLKWAKVFKISLSCLFRGCVAFPWEATGANKERFIRREFISCILILS